MKLRDNRPFEVHGHVWPADGAATVGRHGRTKGLVETIVFKRSGVHGICRKKARSRDRDFRVETALPVPE